MRIFISILLSIVCGVNAATYYVSPTGNDDTGDGSIGSPWLSLSKLNTMSAGDTAYLRGGTYDDVTDLQYFKPSNTGTLANPIIITNYPDESPVITGGNSIQETIDLDSVAYIKLYGLTISNCCRPVQWTKVTNCEMAYCTVTVRGEVPFGTGDAYLVRIWENSHSNWVHHCEISKGMIGLTNVPVAHEGSDDGAVFCVMLGNYTKGSDIVKNNLIENNVIHSGGHDVFTVCGQNNIIRSNWIYNAGWYLRTDYEDIKAGNRALASDGEYGDRNLFEYNRLGPTGWVLDNGSAGFTVSSKNNIIRRNSFYGCANFGVEFYTKDYGAYGTSLSSTNYFYNNTSAYHGWVPNYATNLTTDAKTDNRAYSAHVHIHHSTNDVLLNNVFWRGWGNEWYSIDTNYVISATTTGLDTSDLNNYTNSATDLLFTDAGTPWSDPYNFDTTISSNIPNWRISSTNSALFDAGQFLTTISSANGTGTSFVVVDPNFFCDGYGMIPGDEIQLEGQTTTAKITNVDYATATITVGSVLTWTSGQGIALAYNGSAPDIGAYEYQSGSTPVPNQIGTLQFGPQTGHQIGTLW